MNEKNFLTLNDIRALTEISDPLLPIFSPSSMMVALTALDFAEMKLMWFRETFGVPAFEEPLSENDLREKISEYSIEERP